MSGGSIAGIVIGSIIGTLLILWLIDTVRAESYTPREESSVGRERRSRRRSRRRSHSTYLDRSRQVYRVREPSRVYYKPE
jgi:Na+/glutamate symporter